MRTAWKPFLFVLISIILDGILLIVLFQPDYLSTQERPEGLSIAQGVFHIIWLSGTFILLHRLFELKKWTPGCSAYVVIFSIGGLTVKQFYKFGVNTSFTAVFAVSWIIFASYISFVVDKKSKSKIQAKP